MHQYNDAFAPGWNIPLVSLANTEETFGSRNRDRNSILYPISLTTPVFRPYPIGTELESHRVRGDGAAPFFWDMGMYTPATSYVMSLFTAVSMKWTIYIRLHDLGTYARYNCWAVRPGAAPNTGESDLLYIRQSYMRVIIRFTDLVASS